MIANSHKKGFTLIELIVSVGLFSVVALIAASAYLNLVDIDRRTQATSDLVNNMTFVMNSMASNIRTGSQYACIPGNEGNGTCSEFTFVDSSQCNTDYKFENGGITETQTAAPGGDVSACINTGPLTDSSLTITGMHFVVSGNDNSNSDYLQPQVIIYLTGTMNLGPNPNQTSSFTIQTTATQRGIDLPTTP